MKKKIVWSVVSCLMVLSLILASCAPAAVEEEKAPVTEEKAPEEKVEVAPVEKEGMVKLSLKKLDGTPVEKWVEPPRYGGTFIQVQERVDNGWDQFYCSAGNMRTSEYVTSELLTGDWYRGPAGTEETVWFNREFNLAFEAGDLAESWEVPDAETIIYHIRKGVHWALNPVNPRPAELLVGGRELTADDIVFEMNRHLGAGSMSLKARIGVGYWFVSATAVDKYTVVVKAKEDAIGTATGFARLSDAFVFNPPEVVQKYGDMMNWRNVVGTGPFILGDYVQGSSATFVRNPNYWEKDPLHPQNQLPYFDHLKVLYILETSTRYAAMRAGKTDFVRDVSWEDAESLQKTNPELVWSRQIQDKIWGTLHVRVDTKPFDDIRVRRALSMAIDRPAILRDYYKGNADLPSPCIAPEYKSVYIPLEQLPESTRELFAYHPDRAKQLLAEAGYPDGFKFTALMEESQVDMASIFEAYLAKVGVYMELDLKDPGVYSARVSGFPKTYEEAVFADSQTKGWYEGGFYVPLAPGNYSFVDDPVIAEYRARLTSFENMQNQAELDRLVKELALHFLSQAYVIAPPMPYVYEMWQPWVKNFYGSNMGLTDYNGAFRFLWIDQGLKKQMGR